MRVDNCSETRMLELYLMKYMSAVDLETVSWMKEVSTRDVCLWKPGTFVFSTESFVSFVEFRVLVVVQHFCSFSKWLLP